MSQLSLYLQMRYLGVLLRSMPAVGISIVFVISLQTVDVSRVLDFKAMGCFFMMAFFELLPWLLSIFLYLYLLWLKKHGELKLMESYCSLWKCWVSLLPIWTTFMILMFIYTSFLSPLSRQVLRSQNVLSGLELNQARSVFDGVLWLEKELQALSMNWWYHSGKHEAKLKVGEVRPEGKVLNLGEGQFLVKSPGQGLNLSFQQGKMLVGKELKGSKYNSLKQCWVLNQWGEIGFRMNHMLLVVLATAWMFWLFQSFGTKSLILFVLTMLLCYLPLWSYVKDQREELTLWMAMLPSYLLLVFNLIFALRHRGVLS